MSRENSRDFEQPYYVPKNVVENEIHVPLFILGSSVTNYPPLYVPPSHFGQQPIHHIGKVDSFAIDERFVTGNVNNFYKSVKNMGDFGAFLRGLLTGLFFPILAALVVFAMETSLLSRFGVTLGTANAFVWVAAYLLILGAVLNTNIYFLWSALALAVIAIALFCISSMLWKKYMALYNCEAAEDERLKVDSPLGCESHRWGSLLLSILFPLIGTALVLLMNRSLYARQGALMGLASVFMLAGLICIPWYSLGFISGDLALIVGLLLMQCTFVHFQRAIASVLLDRF